jgi:hypothetical protein
VARVEGALSLWLGQLVVNAAWPGVFFGLEEFGWAIAVIVLLDVLVAATITWFAADGPVGGPAADALPALDPLRHRAQRGGLAAQLTCPPRGDRADPAWRGQGSVVCPLVRSGPPGS